MFFCLFVGVSMATITGKPQGVFMRGLSYVRQPYVARAHLSRQAWS
jgi:hypothetical protein